MEEVERRRNKRREIKSRRIKRRGIKWRICKGGGKGRSMERDKVKEDIGKGDKVKKMERRRNKYGER